jgi:hypothetical protein
VITFGVLAMLGAIVQFFVPVNYNMSEYLPEEAPSIESAEVMDEEFDEAVTNTRVMIKDVNLNEALSFKKQLEAVDGVSDVMWLDDVMDIRTPVEIADDDVVEPYYKDGNALFSFYVEEGREVEITDEIYEVIGEENAMSGESLNTAIAQKMTGQETLNAALILVPLIILILLVSTTSWIEPLFFLTAIGVSVLINLGTNIFVGEISFLTQSVAPILQLAVSLDYAIFLLHSFEDYRKQTHNPMEAMKLAMKRSFPAIATSAMTTIFGFAALTFMVFEIGADLGLNLFKGIIFSFISVIVFLPALTLIFYPLIDKTKHKQWIPSKYNVGKYVIKLRVPIVLLVLIIIFPAFLAQSQTNFLYGNPDQPEHTRAGVDAAEIEETFGKYTPMVLLVPKDIAKEEALVAEMNEMNDIQSITAYTTTIGAAIPPEYLDSSVTEQFLSDNYSRIVLNTEAETEGEATFSMVEDIHSTAESYYGDDYHFVGESVTLYDMKEIVERDNTVVNTLTVVGIGFVVMLAFRSITIPILILITIQTSVWINLSIPYFQGDSLVYIGYLIISIVQLAATVDYAILFSEEYIQNRKEMPALPAVKKTINEKIFSIGVSASILTSVGFILWITSTNEIIASIGLLLGRGALLAFLLVVFLLPALFVVFDRIIEKTSWKLNFYKKE